MQEGGGSGKKEARGSDGFFREPGFERKSDVGREQESHRTELLGLYDTDVFALFQLLFLFIRNE